MVGGVPNEVFSKGLKDKFLRTREQLMRRNFLTQAQNLMLSEWTLPKMLKIANEEEKMLAKRAAEMKRLRSEIK